VYTSLIIETHKNDDDAARFLVRHELTEFKMARLHQANGKPVIASRCPLRLRSSASATSTSSANGGK
jgi:hypothetical protein